MVRFRLLRKALVSRPDRALFTQSSALTRTFLRLRLLGPLERVGDRSLKQTISIYDEQLSLDASGHTSGKSTQNAFIFNPYKKLAKLSLNRVKLSCINCRCMKFASRSAIESASSANCGSRALMAGWLYPALLMLWP